MVARVFWVVARELQCSFYGVLVCMIIWVFVRELLCSCLGVLGG